MKNMKQEELYIELKDKFNVFMTLEFPRDDDGFSEENYNQNDNYYLSKCSD